MSYHLIRHSQRHNSIVDSNDDWVRASGVRLGVMVSPGKFKWGHRANFSSSQVAAVANLSQSRVQEQKWSQMVIIMSDQIWKPVWVRCPKFLVVDEYCFDNQTFILIWYFYKLCCLRAGCMIRIVMCFAPVNMFTNLFWFTGKVT
jgi:hypothetical protein